MFLKKFGDLAAGVFFLILSIALFLAASALPPSLMGGLGSDFMPKVLAIITCILSFFQIRAGFRTMRSFQPNEGAEEEKPEYLRVLATIAADERRHAKRLSTAYFLISGVRYWPEGEKCPPVTSYLGTLRRRFAQEQATMAAYLTGTETTTDPCLQQLFWEHAREAWDQACKIRTLVEQA